MNENLNTDDVKTEFNEMDQIWESSDLWHNHTHKMIGRYLSRYTKQYFEPSFYILNAGSGGNSYGIIMKQKHVDIAENKIRGISDSLVADICSLPFDDCSFDAVICVGSVLNYCDAIVAIQELCRVTKDNGYIILEYENSRSFEFFRTSVFNCSVSIATTFYQHHPEKIWVYSRQYINNILNANNMAILKESCFHVGTPFAYKLLKNPDASSYFSKADILFGRIPFVKWFCSNIILICQKSSLKTQEL